MTKKEENAKRIETFYKKNYKKMVNYAFTLTGNMDDAEDVIQDMSIELLKKQNEKIWNENESLSLSYIMLMVKCRVFNYKDKQKSRPQCDLDDNIDVEEEDYDYQNDSEEEKLLALYIETVNETKKLKDKYARYYHKVRLYKLPMKTAIEQAGVHRNTLYEHFKVLDRWVMEQMQIKLQKNDKTV